ncbi:hypothetical protein [Floridanema evergladense]|uniref:Uncharacterized protein n=1 Tax=Floridaenema evergladense BLCC-F167 TaxID=3153639 RepID=A0ABV4WTW5_9CYAN
MILINPLTALSAGMLGGGVLLGYMIGSAAVNFQQVNEINRLNSEVKNREELIEQERSNVQNHKQFIRTKDTLARRFCDQYFKSEKK